MISDPIQEVNFTTNYTSQGNNSRLTFEYTEGSVSFVRCVSRGGNPTPKMHIFSGKFDITHQFESRVTRIRSGQPGLMVNQYERELFTSEFTPSRDHSGKRLRCVVRIHKHPEFKKSVSAVMNIRCKYMAYTAVLFVNI